MVRFLVLGRFAIEFEGAVIEPPAGRRARSLLAWLLLHPGLHPRSRLAARFWPEVLDASARASLRVALSEVRAALGPAVACLIGDRNYAGIATERVWVDALAFEQLASGGELEAAVALCTGELLPDLDDDWILEARDQHAAALIDALARLASRCEADGDLAGAISLSRRMVAIDPLAEAATRELMRRLAAIGERASALDAYRRLAQRLESQLRIAPGAATRALADELRSPPSTPVIEVEPDPPAVGFELAVSHYQQALERTGDIRANAGRRAELLVGLGDALAHAGRATEAREVYDQARGIAKRLADPQLLARATLGIAGIGVTILDLDEALAALLMEALQALPHDDLALRAELLARLAIARAYSPDRLESGRVANQAVQIARRHGNPATLARALCALHVGLGAPERLEERLAAASEMLRFAERAGDRQAALQARNFRVPDLLEAGDIIGFEREIEAYAALCHEFPLPAFRWYIPLWRATRATINGDFEAAERLAARARRQGHQAGDANAELFWRIQAGTLILARNRIVEADTAWVEDHARHSPAGAAWWTLLSWAWAEQGRRADARTVLDRLAVRDFSVLERDTNWFPGVAELIQAAASLQDADRAAALHRQLAPFSGRIITAARGAQAYGPVDYFLGLAALTTQQPDTARNHLAAALELSQSCGAELWASNARQQLAENLLSATGPASTGSNRAAGSSPPST
jgi:DNA-binding SARP family transcriptional activator